MAVQLMLRTYLPALARSFDEAVQTDPSGRSRGWGQFLTEHHHQVGTYGTCAGIMVKTYAAAAAAVPEEAISYLERELHDAGEGGSKFTQTARLAFLVLATARAEGAGPRTLRDEGSRRLLDAQDADGAWGDWVGASKPPPRVEATTWAVLALSRLDQPRAKAAAELGAGWLRRQVEASPDVGARADAVTLGTILTVLRGKDVDRRTIDAATRILSTKPGNAPRISFFDFLASGGDGRLRRDFLCVPAFFGYALLASSPGLSSSVRSRLRGAGASRMANEHVAAILASGKPFMPVGATYPSTVDQAFVALACDVLDARRTKLDRAYTVAERCLRWVSSSFVVPVLAVAVLAIQTAFAQNPTLAAGYLAWMGGLTLAPVTSYIVDRANEARLVAVLLALFTGKPLVDRIAGYVRRKVRWPWW